MAVKPDLTGVAESQPPVKEICSGSFADILELVRAAEIIGLGIELSNRARPAAQGGFTEEWILTLYSEAPGRVGSER